MSRTVSLMVRIADLARQMIQLSGASVRDAGNPDGDIEIHYTGLRPGEKLHEELLLANASDPTAHPLIRLARQAALRRWDQAAALAVLRQLVPDYQPAATAPVHGPDTTLAPSPAGEPR